MYGEIAAFYEIAVHFTCWMIFPRGRLTAAPAGMLSQPKTESRKPAAMAEPMTPATLGPMACIRR